MIKLAELFAAFFKIGIMGFGGGYTIISIASHELINKNWLDISTFSDIIAIAQMTPGPIAINLATFTGYRIAGLWGAVVSTIGVVSPSVILITVFARIIAKAENHPLKEHIFSFLRPAALGLVVFAAYLLVSGAVLGAGGDFYINLAGIDINIVSVIVFFASLFLLSVCKISPPIVMLVSALAGIVIKMIKIFLL